MGEACGGCRVSKKGKKPGDVPHVSSFLLSGALHKYGDMGPASLARDPVRKIPPRIPRKKFAVLRQKSFANWQGFSSASTAKKVTTDEHTDPCSSVFICEAATEYLRRYELSRPCTSWMPARHLAQSTGTPSTKNKLTQTLAVPLWSDGDARFTARPRTR